MRRIQLFLTFSTLVLALSFFTGCEKDDSSVYKLGMKLTVEAKVSPFVSTRINAADNSIKWSRGDRLGLFEKVGNFYKNNSNIEFTLVDGAESTEATFTGNAVTFKGWAKEDKEIFAYYPYDPKRALAHDLLFTLPSDQIQNVDNPGEHIAELNCLYAATSVVDSRDNSKVSLEFQSLLAKVDFDIVNEASQSMEISGASFASLFGTNIFYTDGVFNFNLMEFDASLAAGKRSSMEVELSNTVVVPAGGSYKISLLIFPMLLPKGSGTFVLLKNDVQDLFFPTVIEDPDGFYYESGKSYTHTLTINEESFIVPELTSVELPQGQNCYLVRPPDSYGETIQYLIPVTRVNEFWNNSVGNNPSNSIGVQTNWVAELIWKNVDYRDRSMQLIELSPDRTTGTGTGDFIGVNVNYKPSELYGSAVIGIKKADAFFRPVGDYLWSWHVWVSDYDGQLVDASGVQGYEIMDRNLGAKNAFPGDPGALGFYFQWGRKDPIIGVDYDYWLNGGTQGAEPTDYVWPSVVGKSPETGNVPFTVNNPTTIIRCTDPSGSETPEDGLYDWQWAPVGGGTSTLWQNTVKTLYDPCPKGYKVARRNSFDGINPGSFPIDLVNRGRTYGDAWFPFCGYRSSTTGNITNGRSYTYIFTSGSSTNSVTLDGVSRTGMYARTLYYNTTVTTANPDNRVKRAACTTIRCMRFPADD
ncbi:MAG: fimbrillin family protein [Bacteroidales bacterium]